EIASLDPTFTETESFDSCRYGTTATAELLAFNDGERLSYIVPLDPADMTTPEAIGAGSTGADLVAAYGSDLTRHSSQSATALAQLAPASGDTSAPSYGFDFDLDASSPLVAQIQVGTLAFDDAGLTVQRVYLDAGQSCFE